MGTGAFIYANSYSEYGLVGSGVLGPGAFIMYLILKVFREVAYRCKTGKWTKDESSSWKKEEDGKIRWISIVPLLGNIACNIGYTIVMTFAWNFAE